jgi:mRNA interferase MazF
LSLRLGKNSALHPKLIMTAYNRGDVVLPAVVISVPEPDSQRNMAVVVPLTTEMRGGECEVSFPKPPWLRQESVVNVLGIAGVDKARIQRRLSSFPKEKLAEIESTLRRMLGL